MRDRLELPRLSKAERDRRWSMTREQMRARGNRLSSALGVAGDVGFHDGQCPLSVPDRR